MDDSTRLTLERKTALMAKTLRADFRREVKLIFKQHVAEATLAGDKIAIKALKDIQRDIVALVDEEG